MAAENPFNPDELPKPETDPADLEKPDNDKSYDIQIDRMHYTVSGNRLTGADIRNIPKPPIPPERDLFEVVPGRPDRQVKDDDRILIRDGLRFFTVPGTINPGCPRGKTRTPRWLQ